MVNRKNFVPLRLCANHVFKGAFNDSPKCRSQKSKMLFENFIKLETRCAQPLSKVSEPAVQNEEMDFFVSC